MTKNGESASNGESAVKTKDFFFSVQGKSAWYFFMVFCSFVLCQWGIQFCPWLRPRAVPQVITARYVIINSLHSEK